MSKKDEYVAKMKLQLDELNAEMQQLSDKAKEARQEVRAAYQQEMAKVRHQSDLAKARMEDLKLAGEDKWDAMVAEMEKVRDAFVHSFSYFKSQVK